MAHTRFLLTAWPWRSAAYLLSSLPVGVATLAVLLVFGTVGSALLVVVIGVLVLAAVVFVGIPVGGIERRRLRLVDDEPVRNPHVVPVRAGLRAWIRTRIGEQATWRELAHALLLAVLLWPLDLAALGLVLSLPAALLAAPVELAVVGDGHQIRVLKVWLVDAYPQAVACAAVGLVMLGAAGYVLAALAGVRAALARALTSPTGGEGDPRITELSRSRVRLVDAFEAERLRIERDLHDGAQQRLIALTMTLGLAVLDCPPGPVADLVAKAHEEAGRVLVDLRELIHGIRPHVLADRGLAAAVVDAAERTSLRVRVDVELAERLPRTVESAAYFVVCEALANITKHSLAERAWITGRYGDGQLTVEVGDDGTGGATTREGGGLIGLGDRVAVLNGRLTLSSPPGGPTLLRAEFPC